MAYVQQDLACRLMSRLIPPCGLLDQPHMLALTLCAASGARAGMGTMHPAHSTGGPSVAFAACDSL